MKIIRHMSWLVGGRVLGALLGLISTAVLARLLTPADFGVIAAAFVVLSLANVIFDGAFGLNLIRKEVLRPEDIQTTLTAGLGLGVLLALALVLLSGLVQSFFDFPNLQAVLVVSSVVIPLKAVFAIATARMQRDGRFSAIALISLASQFAGYIVVAVPLSLAGAGVWALVAALVVAGLVEAVAAAVVARLSWSLQLDRATLSEIASTGFLSLANMLNWVANTGANAVVGHTLGAASLGFYSRGWKLLDLFVHSVATPLSKVLIPAFSRLRSDAKRLEESLLDTLSVALIAYTVASVLLTLHADLIVRLALGPQWGATIPVVQILFATLVPRCAFKVTEGFAVASGRAGAAALRQGFYAVLMVGGCLVGARFGLIGVSMAAAVAISAFYLLSLAYAVRLTGVRVSRMVRMHAVCALLALILVGIDAGVARLVPVWIPYADHILPAVCAGVAALIIIGLAPAFWLGTGNGERLIVLLQSSRRRLFSQPT
ncbi:hypothetical protein MMB232_01166 [Brevundimonas subvibrioides]|uniref:oligosaccharide flippase family protein n=1 Tax=Brevundimonas subvibrioides TaxID=74313 RepID=UPI0032D58675